MESKPVPQYGSDYIVDILKALGIEYVSLNPGSTFRGIHDSIVNYGGNSRPEVIQCNHEEIAVALAHGYAKASGKPMAAIVHDIVGLQHATMAIFNAWCDRVPLLVMGGNTRDAARRRVWIDWVHTAQSPGNLVRDYVKWDDEPASVEAVPDSLLRAWKIALTEPTGPVYVCLDVQIQERKLPGPIPVPDVHLYEPASEAYPDSSKIEQLAHWLLEASSPAVIVDRLVKDEKDMLALKELAELLALPVLDKGGRFNFPSNHPLDLTGAESEVLEKADLVLALEVGDLAGSLQIADVQRRQVSSVVKEGVRIAHIGMGDFLTRGWSSDYQKLQGINMAIGANAGASLRQLLPLCKALLRKAGRTKSGEIKDRKRKYQEKHQSLCQQWREEAVKQEASKPIHHAALAAHLWDLIRKEDWVLAGGSLNGWARRLWDLTKPGQSLGHSGGAGLGYGPGASVGAALAHRGSGKLCINFQADGDFLYCPQALWTAAHHQIPLLFVMDNNRSYLNSENHALTMARERGRPAENRWIGTTIEKPFVDFKGLASSFGLHAEGPVENLEDLKPALKRAIQVIKKENRPALVDVVTAKIGRGRSTG